MASTFTEGAQFSSWEAFLKAFEQYKDETFQPFITVSSRTTSAANQRIKDGKLMFPNEMKFANMTFQCTHRGCFKSKSEGLRKASSFKSGCLAKVYASVDKVSKRVVVQIINAEHNHDISSATYAHYPKKRLLQKDEETGLAPLCKLKVSTKMLRQHAVEQYGKKLTLKDVSNIKSRVRANTKIVEGESLNDAQLLLTRVKEEKEKDAGASIHVGVRSDHMLRYLFFQSSYMKAMFNLFPEHVLVDATYCLNDRQMPLLTFMCVDGNLESHVIALALVCEESKEMLSLIFDILRTQNPCTERLKTFMVDKDMNEISCLQTAFPNASIEICLFHVQKAMKKKISELVCDRRVKDDVRECCSKVCYARSEREYEEWKEKLLQCNEEFASYFLEHWDSIRDKWVQFERSKHLNFSNRTNNRLESYHQKLKSEVPRNAPLDVMFDNILLVLETLKNEISHRQFQATLRQTISSEYPSLQKQLTPFAFSHAIAELDKAKILQCEVFDDYVIVHGGGGERVVRDDVCDCSVFVSKGLPCCHVMASRLATDMLPLAVSMFSVRWMRCNQTITAHPPGSTAVTLHELSSSFSASTTLSKSQKFKAAKVLALKIADKMSELGMSDFRNFLEKLNDFDESISMLNNDSCEGGGVHFGEGNFNGVRLGENSLREVRREVHVDSITEVGFENDVESGSGDGDGIEAVSNGDRQGAGSGDGDGLEYLDAGRGDRDGIIDAVSNGAIRVAGSGDGDRSDAVSGNGDGIDAVSIGARLGAGSGDGDRLDGGRGDGNGLDTGSGDGDGLDIVSGNGNGLDAGSGEGGRLDVMNIDTIDSGSRILYDLIQSAKPPLGLSKRGRPKGSGLTVLGGERKRKKKKSSGRLSLKLVRGDNGAGPGACRPRSSTHNMSSQVFLSSSKETECCSELLVSPLSPAMSRTDFFSSAQELLSSCQSFEELSVVAASLSQSMVAYPLPDMEPRRVGEVGVVDTVALKLLHEATPHFSELLFPVAVVGDGNCIPRSLSVFCFGNQNHYREVRCRIVVELVTNFHDFLNLPQDDLNLLCQFSDCLCTSPMETFQQETLKVSKNSEYMGIWQLMAAARLFKTPILSVYPSLGPETYKNFFNRTIYPNEILSSEPPCAVFWCATQMHQDRLPNEYWTANHVVPLLNWH